MSSPFKHVVIALVVVFGCTLARASQPPLRVCADPNNMPFSNMREEGFENMLARMVAHDLHRDMQFVWWPQRARFVEKWLKAQTCDLVMGINPSSDLVTTTKPYYRSTYVFVSKRSRNLDPNSLTDATLQKYRIGAQIIGDEGESVPPAQELAKRGMVRNIVGYSLYGQHPLAENPSAEIITAVAHGDVDLAVAWGPMAAYFARQSSVPLRVTAICPSTDRSAVPLAFDVSMGVRRGDDLLRDQLNTIIDRRRKEIDGLLRSYGVPLLEGTQARPECH
jgi:mxaJ protein